MHRMYGDGYDNAEYDDETPWDVGVGSMYDYQNEMAAPKVYKPGDCMALLTDQGADLHLRANAIVISMVGDIANTYGTSYKWMGAKKEKKGELFEIEPNDDPKSKGIMIYKDGQGKLSKDGRISKDSKGEAISKEQIDAAMSELSWTLFEGFMRFHCIKDKKPHTQDDIVALGVKYLGFHYIEMDHSNNMLLYPGKLDREFINVIHADWKDKKKKVAMLNYEEAFGDTADPRIDEHPWAFGMDGERI